MHPWAWTPDPQGGQPPLLASTQFPNEIGVLHSSSRPGLAHPWRSGASGSHPSPWGTLLAGFQALGAEAELRWVATPVGPSAPARLPGVAPVPRSDDETPLPVHPVQALSRELEDLRGHRSTGPYWEVGGVVALKPGRPGAKIPWTEVGSLLEAVSGQPGGATFGLSVIRGESACQRVVRSMEGSLPPRGRLSALGLPPVPGRMSPAELTGWLPPWEGRSVGSLAEDLPEGGWPLRFGVDPAGDPVSLGISPTEGHHVTIAGETGMGKSTLMQTLAAEFARRGASVILLDPVGDTARGLLPLLPAPARGRALWISPLRSPLGVNPLDAPPGVDPTLAEAERERRVHELSTMLLRVRARRFGSTLFWGPRMDDVLNRVLLFLSLCPGATLRSAEDLLEDPEHWAGPLPEGEAPRRQAQTLFESLQRENREDLQGTLRLVREVALSTSISQVLCGRQEGWSLGRALEPGAVTLVVLERAAVGVRPSSYLGGALLSLLWSHLLARPTRTKVVLLLDEVQEYENDALGEMLRLGRRYNLHVVSATQSLSALPKELQEVLYTNSRDIVLFRGSPKDGELADRWNGGSSETYLPGLPRGTALALLGKGSQTTVVRVRPLTSVLVAAQVDEAIDQRILATRALGAAPSGTDAPRSEGSTPVARQVLPPDAGPPPRSVDLAPELQDPLLSLLVASLEAPEGEPFAVELERVRRLCGGEVKVFRELGARLERSGALQAKERREGRRVWWLLREGLSELVPPPWPAGALSEARRRWEASAAPEGSVDP